MTEAKVISLKNSAPEKAEFVKVCIGDKVILASGGPVMTVRSIKGNTVVCNWFKIEDELDQADFHPDMLLAYSDDPQDQFEFEPDDDTV